MLGWLIAGAGVIGTTGNFIRSWKTDENIERANAKNRKAKRIVDEAVDAFEEAAEYAKTEQENMIAVKEDAYKSLLEFAETFKSIDDVRFKESVITQTARISKLDSNMFAQLRDIEFTSEFHDNTPDSDLAGMLSMLLPVGIGSFGSFSSLRASEAAVEEAIANVYEAESMARELESMTLVTRALGDRTKLIGDVLKGIYEKWFFKANREFKYLVDSKDTIKYYFVDVTNTSAYTDEEYAFIATLSALAKTVKTLIDVPIFDEQERESQELSPKSQTVKQIEAIQEDEKKDKSFGLKSTYCAQLIEGKVKTDELVRPSDGFVDDFAATRQRLAREGYDSVCKFDDYLKTTKTKDTQEIRKRYFDVCDSLFADYLYQKLSSRIKSENKRFGVDTLCILKSALEECDESSIELDNLLEYLEENVQNKLGRNGKPKFGQGGFKGLKRLVHMCLFEIEGRRQEKVICLGERVSQMAIEAGYENRGIHKLPTRTFREERKRKAKPWDGVIATIILGIIIVGLAQLSLITWDRIALPIFLYGLFVITNRGEMGALGIIQRVLCLGTVGVCGHIFYVNARALMAMPRFSLVNGIVLGASLVLLLFVHETKEYRNLYLSRVLWILSISAYVFFGIMALEKFTKITWGLLLGTIIQVIAILISLAGLNKKANLQFEKTHATDVKTLAGVCVMTVPAGLFGLYVLTDYIIFANAFTIILLVLGAIVAYITGALSAAVNMDIVKGVGIVFVVASSVLIGGLFYALLIGVLNAAVNVAMSIAIIIYLAMACFMCFAISAEA